MNAHLSTKKRLLIGIPTVLITAGVLIACWQLLSKDVFFIVLMCLAVIGIIAERLVKIYEKRKGVAPKNE